MLEDALRERGAAVEVLALYRTVAEDLGDPARAAALGCDYATFTSASSARLFARAAGTLAGPRLVSIGPVTSDGAAGARPRPGRRGRPHTPDGLVAALLADASREAVRARSPSSPTTGSPTTSWGLHAGHGADRPQARVIDLSHGVPRHDVLAAALMLARALPSRRRASTSRWSTPRSARAGGHRAAHRGGGPPARRPRQRAAVAGRPALRRHRGGGGHVALVHRLEPVSATFHGRDIFAPVAAALPRARSSRRRGRPARRRRVVRLHMPLARVEPDGLVAHAIAFDGFGNVTLDVEHEELTGAGLRLGRRGDRQRPARALRHDLRRRRRRATCCSTRTPSGRSRSPSTAARRARRSALELDAELRITAG